MIWRVVISDHFSERLADVEREWSWEDVMIANDWIDEIARAQE